MASPALIPFPSLNRKAKEQIMEGTEAWELGVLAQLPQPDGGLNASRVLYIDGENTFDPYGIANLAVTRRLDTTRTLSNIFLARAFQWGQVVEIVREKLVIAATAKDMPLVCIVGLTTMLTPADQVGASGYEGVLQVIAGLKDLLARTRDGPAIVATTRLHPASGTKPLGGTPCATFAKCWCAWRSRPRSRNTSSSGTRRGPPRNCWTSKTCRAPSPPRRLFFHVPLA